MARRNGLSDAMNTFLRAFHDHPAGPPRDEWPHPAVLRRWMRREGFRRALDSIKQTLRLKADLHLATTSSLAMHKLQTNLMDLDDARSIADAGGAIDAATRLLRLSHHRQRFLPPDLTDNDPGPPRRPHDVDSLHLDLITRLTEMYEFHNHVLDTLRSAPPNASTTYLRRRLDLAAHAPKHLGKTDPEKRRRIIEESKALLRDLQREHHPHPSEPAAAPAPTG